MTAIIIQSWCGRQMFYVACGTQHFPGFIIRTSRQNIIKSMEARGMLGQVRVASVGDRWEEMGLLKLLYRSFGAPGSAVC